MLKIPVAVTAEMDSFHYYGVHTGQGDPIVRVKKTQGELRLHFGYCPQPPSANYACATNADRDVRYYTERKLPLDPANDQSFRAEFAMPPDPMLCTDGSTAK